MASNQSYNHKFYNKLQYTEYDILKFTGTRHKYFYTFFSLLHISNVHDMAFPLIAYVNKTCQIMLK